jgi:ABC-type nitrate/sulfonate/bicarbonate transport system substrate-binding protein
MSKIMSRRDFLGYAAAGVASTAAGALPIAAKAQGLTKVKYTTPWVAEGSSLYAYVAKRQGFWKKRGLDVEVARGYGSVAATQAIAAGQFDVGHAVTSVMILQNAKGLPLQSIAQLTYRNTMGVVVLADSPIKTPKDLEGKTLGVTPTSGEVPFLPVFARNSGLDLSKVKLVNMNIEVRYRALMDKQIDAMTDFGISAIPPLVTQGYPVRCMLFSNYGMDMYESSLMATPKMIKERPEMLQGIVDGAMEAVAFSLLNPEKALDIFMEEVPEAGMSAKGRDNVKAGLGIFQFAALGEEARHSGFGWANAKNYAEMNDLVNTYLMKGGPKPAVDSLYTNRFAGKIKFDDAQWARAKKRNEEFAKFFT